MLEDDKKIRELKRLSDDHKPASMATAPPIL